MMSARIQQPLSAFPRQQRGAMLVLVVIALAAMLLMGALALDGGHMLVNKSRLQNAVDAAALSGAKTLSTVMGTTGAASLTQTAALNTLTLNASASGNQELAAAIGNNVGGFATVELASTVYGPFSFPGPANASYVRVTVTNYSLAGFFWGVFQTLGNGVGNKFVSAVATAGPSPASPCDLTPLMVCGDPTKNNPSTGMFWGFQFGDPQVLKTAAGNSSPIGPGNFQLLDFGSGGSTVRQGLAGGISQCNSVGSNVQTKPGNTVGPASQGLNTRFNEYSGGLKAADYPPDLVITVNQKSFTYDDALKQIQYNNQAVTSSSGNLSAAGSALYDYHDWVQDSASCVAGSGGGCQNGGAFERRIIKIVIGDCSGKNDGASSIPVLGFGCYFVLQPASQQGNESQIFGQFQSVCEGDNVPGPNPANTTGPQIIQLYKTYIDNSQTPSTDS
ncbi:MULTISPECIES: TadE/TadG family type IV pilus assembly protein [Pseudomonas]|uniref:TadE/TadG family type IV pilus assembly protein n=1 Tax=Pseudomonas TaxID=286 RepID=UPI000CD2A087|nr:TadE/TadG family type IV pilus assembly protein [Pseudomonas sp. GW531-T4]POA66566.1 pilus assembly protein [Pseudomonas sp. GW531-T4]